MSVSTALAVALVAAAGGRADKQALYGDPALVPTRAGEVAREELAVAAAVAAALAAQADADAPVVEVRLPSGTDAGAVVVAGVVGLAPAEVVGVAEAVAGPWSVGRVEVFVRAGAPSPGESASRPAAPAAMPWGLGLALLGLGASAGIAVDRRRRG